MISSSIEFTIDGEKEHKKITFKNIDERTIFWKQMRECKSEEQLETLIKTWRL